MISFLKGMRDTIRVAREERLNNYYTKVDEIPVFNFFKVAKGEFKYLYRDIKDYGKPFNEDFFKYIFSNMYFQFKKLDNRALRNKADLEVYWSKWIVEGNYRWKNEYNTLKAKLDKEVSIELDLDDFTDYIERTLNQPVGSIDVHKVSASKAFNNYHRAIALNKNRENANN